VSKINDSTEAGVKFLPEARHWWFTPVILATLEAEIRRIAI
jgi:hypothetical protein